MDTDNHTQLSQLNQNVLVKQHVTASRKPLLTIHGSSQLEETVATLHKENVTLEIWSDTIKNAREDRDNAEHVYSVPQTVALAGKTYAGLRRKINFCRRFHNPQLRLVDSSAYESMWQLNEKISQEQEIAHEAAALEKYFLFAHTLGAQTWGMYIRNSLVGFAVTEEIPSKTLLIHFFKTDLEITGLAETLFYQIAHNVKDTLVTINFEQDLGLPGLRRFKQSLRPVTLLTPYVIE
jgi:hypothetical protein